MLQNWPEMPSLLATGYFQIIEAINPIGSNMIGLEIPWRSPNKQPRKVKSCPTDTIKTGQRGKQASRKWNDKGTEEEDNPKQYKYMLNSWGVIWDWPVVQQECVGPNGLNRQRTDCRMRRKHQDQLSRIQKQQQPPTRSSHFFNLL